VQPERCPVGFDVAWSQPAPCTLNAAVQRRQRDMDRKQDRGSYAN
jgi:hypothetical protein